MILIFLMMRSKPLLPLATACLLFAGCASQAPLTLPPISQTPTGLSNPGQVIWHDLATMDIDRAKAFYGEMFGWTFSSARNGPRKYTQVFHDGEPIGGMFLFEEDEKANPFGEWLINLSTDDVDATAAAFESAGSIIRGEPRDAPDRGRSAFIQDPQKAFLIVTESSSGDPPVKETIPFNSWLWNELWANDAPAAFELYSSIFGYGTRKIEAAEPGRYYVLTKQDKPLAGIVQMDLEDVRPHWVPFIRVEDVHATVKRAEALGAVVLIAPQEGVRDGRVGLLQAPTGEPIVVQEFDFDN